MLWKDINIIYRLSKQSKEKEYFFLCLFACFLSFTKLKFSIANQKKKFTFQIAQYRLENRDSLRNVALLSVADVIANAHQLAAWSIVLADTIRDNAQRELIEFSLR